MGMSDTVATQEKNFEEALTVKNATRRTGSRQAAGRYQATGNRRRTHAHTEKNGDDQNPRQ
jgi:hypothetical protein